MKHTARIGGMAIAILFLSACDLAAPAHEPEISNDKDFDSLVALVADKLVGHEAGVGKNESEWDDLFQAFLNDPVILSLATELRKRYPDLHVENADQALEEYLQSRGIAAKGVQGGASKVSDAQYQACLASVASMGVIMMAGCAMAGPFAIPCGAAVVTWVGAQSALCHLAAIAE